MPIPRKLAEKGVKDMLRVSDAHERHAYGTIVLHVSPEAEADGPIGLVRSGDRVRLSVAEHRLDLAVDAADSSAGARSCRARRPAPSAAGSFSTAITYSRRKMAATSIS